MDDGTACIEVDLGMYDYDCGWISYHSATGSELHCTGVRGFMAS